MTVNQHGLKRHIPSDVRRAVRKRSKFGCVVCRSGFYQYEHIDPEYHEARIHDPERMCCLCAGCHDRVTRGQLSKAAVAASYKAIQATAPDDVEPPRGPLDFYTGRSEVALGGVGYVADLRSIIRYNGQDLLSVAPGADGEAGSISAVFFDDQGQEVLWPDENEWIGSLDAWDIEVVGQRLTVRKKLRETVLQLRLDPPGRIIIEHLDMRLGDAHVLATETAYALGRYVSETDLMWFHARLNVRRSTFAGSLFEFLDPSDLEDRLRVFGGQGQHLVEPSGMTILDNLVGVGWRPMGIVVASLTGSYDLYAVAAGGPRPLERMRRKVFELTPEFEGYKELNRYIGSGE